MECVSLLAGPLSPEALPLVLHTATHSYVPRSLLRHPSSPPPPPHRFWWDVTGVLGAPGRGRRGPDDTEPDVGDLTRRTVAYEAVALEWLRLTGRGV